MDVLTADQDEALQTRIRLAPGLLIASRIKRARKISGLSHDRIGELVGTSRQHLIKLEKALHRPRADMLKRIAAATGRDVDWFLDPEVDPSPFPEDADSADGARRRADRRAHGLPQDAPVKDAA